MARLKFELHLPGLVIGVDDIKLTGLGRRFGRAKPAGPYLIAGRASGLAPDTGLQYTREAVSRPGHLTRYRISSGICVRAGSRTRSR
jgi:hypothetical protein